MYAIVVTSDFEMYAGQFHDSSPTVVTLKNAVYLGKSYTDDGGVSPGTESAFNVAVHGEPELAFTADLFIPSASFSNPRAIFQCSERSAKTFEVK